MLPQLVNGTTIQYSPSYAPSSVKDLPDEYFTPTAADLKTAQAQLSARTQALYNAPLKPRSIRDAEVKAKRDRWPQVISHDLWILHFVDRCFLDNYPRKIHGPDSA